jgi:Putative Ig domain
MMFAIAFRAGALVRRSMLFVLLAAGPAVASAAVVMSGSPPTSVAAGQAYSFVPTASTSAQHTLWFTIANKPTWATFSNSTGHLSGTPTAAQAGTYSNIVISVTDTLQQVSLPAFSIQVQSGVNNPPGTSGSPLVISGSPPTSDVAGQPYSFVPTASTSAQHTLWFTIANKPTWATFSNSSGRLSGTPTAAQAGTYSNIVISVTDTLRRVSLPAFSIQVQQSGGSGAPSGVPTISGQPATAITAASAYSFKPTAADSDGDTLTFAIQNKPSWATFNATTGVLSGVPAAADVGTYANILISVSDGRSTAALPAFTITVNQISTGTATVSWAVPTTNSDGTPLTNLAGYRIYYGTSAGALNQVITVSGTSLMTYVVSNLGSGTWYFAVTDYTSAGVESSYSNIVSKAIP